MLIESNPGGCGTVCGGGGGGGQVVVTVVGGVVSRSGW